MVFKLKFLIFFIVLPQNFTQIPEPSFVRTETEIQTEGNLASSQFQVFTIFDARNNADLPSYHDVVVIDLPTYEEIMQNYQNLEFDRSFVQR